MERGGSIYVMTTQGKIPYVNIECTQASVYIMDLDCLPFIHRFSSR